MRCKQNLFCLRHPDIQSDVWATPAVVPLTVSTRRVTATPFRKASRAVPPDPIRCQRIRSAILQREPGNRSHNSTFRLRLGITAGYRHRPKQLPANGGSVSNGYIAISDSICSIGSVGSVGRRTQLLEPVSKPFHNNFQLARHLHEC